MSFAACSAEAPSTLLIHARSLLGEKRSGRATDASRRPGDDRSLAVERAHGSSFPRFQVP
jgi:hypothetical protein